MVEIGIPIYKARKTLPNLLDSIIAQTYKDFQVCFSIDGDNEDYQDIIDTYTARGLKIRVIKAEENSGAGIARQRIFDTTEADYLIFADADDLLMPYAIEKLYKKITSKNYSIVKSGFIRKKLNETEDATYGPQDCITTWFHGKIYSVDYIKNLGLRFLDIRTDEDSYFNFVAWNATINRAEINEPTYIWIENKESITSKVPDKEYFCNTYMNYIRSQVEGLIFMFDNNHGIPDGLISQTLINIYNYYIRAKYYKLNGEVMENCIGRLREYNRIQEWLYKIENWQYIINTVKTGAIYDKQYVVFFNETFNLWAERLLVKKIEK